MPVMISAVTPAMPAFQLAMAIQLRNMCNAHFGAVIGSGTGIGAASCCAAVAIAPHASYDAATVDGQTFSVVFGNSRIFTGMDPDANNITDPSRFKNGIFSMTGYEEHAEQIAIRTCESVGLPFANLGGVEHLYVQLPPCAGCAGWLMARPENWVACHT